MSFVLGGAGTESRSVYPVPAVNATLSAVPTEASSKSPLTVVVALPLFGAVLVAVATTATSREFDVATPEYSKMAKRKGPETVIDAVMVYAPALIFSA